MTNPKFSVKIIGCKDLMRKGISLTANPYVKLKLGQQPKRKTGVLDKTINPLFGTWCDFPAWPKNDILIVSVWNFNTFTQNEFLGQLQFEYPNDPSGKTVINQKLRPDANNADIRGTIQLEIYHIEKHRSHVKAQKAARAKLQAAPKDPATAAILDMMRKGDKWVYYDGQQPRECLLWYLDSTSGNLGYIVWTSRVGGDPRAPMSSRHTLPVSTLKKICLGDASPHANFTTEPEFCLSLQGSRVTHNLLGASDKQRDDWLAGLKWILESRGKHVKNQDEDKKEEPAAAGTNKKARRMTVEPTAKPQVHAQPATPTKVRQDRPVEYRGEINEQIKGMIEGVDVLQYSIDGSGNAATTPVRLVFSVAGGKFGSLSWQEKTRDGSKKLLLHECTDIYVGKQQDIFKSTIAETADNGSCLSIVDQNLVGLHVQFPSADVLKEWMLGVNKILTSTGSKVLMEDEEEQKAAPTADKKKKKERHFSVAVKKAKPSNPDVLNIAKGAFFTRYRQKKSRKDRSVKTEIYVFQSAVVNADGKVTGTAAEAGGLYWYERSANDESKTKAQQWIAINTITDIFTGKQHDIFENRCACDAKDENVLSIRGQLHTKTGKPQDIFLHLEAESQQQVESWVRALTYLLQLGGRITTDDPKEAPQENLNFLSDALAAEAAQTTVAGAAGEKKKKNKRVSVIPPNWGKSKIDDDPFAALVGGSQQQLDMTSVQPQSRPENPFAEEDDDPFADRDTNWTAFGANEETDLGSISEKKTDDPFDDLLSSGFAAVPESATPAAGDDELSRYLAFLNLSDILPTLQKEEIDMETLKMFTPDDLKDLGLAAGPRVKIIRGLPNWKG